VVLSGAFTKLASQVTGLEKSYRATIRFGVETDTLDPEGRVVAEAPLPTEEVVRSRARSFVGLLNQVPPAYSAVHQGGERAYVRARRGEVVAPQARAVRVYELDIDSVSIPEVTFQVRCSKGTYVRALARDLALACGSRGHLTALQRLSVGPFHVDEAVEPQDFDPRRDVLSSRQALARIPGLHLVAARGESEGRILQGAALRAADLVSDPGAASTLAVLGSGDRLLAVADRSDEGYRYRFVVPQDSGPDNGN
jgi:tRNA pseudouridine55 synthase